MEEHLENNIYVDNKICVVVVLFNPTAEQIKRIESLSGEGVSIIAVDNSSQPLKDSTGWDYIPLNENKGIATAQNTGIKEAIRRGFEYIVFFDQDSRFDKHYLNDIYQEYTRIKSIETHVATIGPVVIDANKGVEYKNYMSEGKNYEEVMNIISSGSIVSTETFKIVGLYNDAFFIDLVDSEWCMRAKSKGLKTYMSRNVKLYHSIGNKYKKYGPLVCGLSSPGRYYYQYRNTLWMLPKGYVPFKWKYRTTARRLLDMVLYPIMSDNGIEVLRNMLKGIRDGFKRC